MINNGNNMNTESEIITSDWKKNKANYWALTPISFLERTCVFSPKRTLSVSP